MRAHHEAQVEEFKRDLSKAADALEDAACLLRAGESRAAFLLARDAVKAIDPSELANG